MNPIVAHSPLTTTDITRLPSSAAPIAQAAPQTLTEDTFEPQQKKTSFLTKAVITVVGLAAVAVVLKRFCPNLLKIDANAPKWTDNIKKGITKVADWAEWPFIKIKNLFTKKGADAAEGAGKAAAEGTEKGAAEAGKKAADAGNKAAAKAGKKGKAPKTSKKPAAKPEAKEPAKSKPKTDKKSKPEVKSDKKADKKTDKKEPAKSGKTEGKDVKGKSKENPKAQKKKK